MRVMMSAAGSAVAPSIIRHIQSLGHYVIGHDCLPYGSAANEFFQSPLVSHAAYLSTLMLRDDVQLYLPFLDEEMRLFAKEGVWAYAACSTKQVLAIFTSKVLQQYSLEHKRLPVAPFEMIGSIVAKPDHGRGGKGVIRTGDPGIIDGLISAGYTLQKFIEGDEYTIDVLTGLDGAFLFAVPRLRIQANGVSVIGRIVMDEEIIDLARQVVSKFSFRGPINIQVIRERETRKLYIIELNPRLSGSCIFTVMAGFDILDATIKLWEGKPFVPPSRVEEITVRRHYVEERL